MLSYVAAQRLPLLQIALLAVSISAWQLPRPLFPAFRDGRDAARCGKHCNMYLQHMAKHMFACGWPPACILHPLVAAKAVPLVNVACELGLTALVSFVILAA